jgi:hypothetical protein
MPTWECANCDHATDNRELAAQHLTECEGVGEYPTELDPEPWVAEGSALWETHRAAESSAWHSHFDPRPGYVQDRNAYCA